ncbi:hypothetical protein P879_06181 [Paragonimus westermani]|uniref:Galactosyltransferase N-terminal domain-containing protein n=1 Tax=Paragonimus westermani TaxID=34504 RepID=A0A8T0D436_9TREM|nr:hypothetical protein P879_06181 [Paragonimus westermani]
MYQCILPSLRVDLRRVSRLSGLFVPVLFGLYRFLPAHDTQPDPNISTILQLPTDVELCNSHVTTRQPYVSNHHHPYRMALLIPFQERFTELQQFLVHLERFLNNQNVIHTFYVLNQEDDEPRPRILRSGLNIPTPSNISSGINAFRSIHNEARHARDKRTYYHPEVKRLLRTLSGGLDSVNYTVDTRQLLTVNGIPVVFFNVRLHCSVDPEICGPL